MKIETKLTNDEIKLFCEQNQVNLLTVSPWFNVGFEEIWCKESSAWSSHEERTVYKNRRQCNGCSNMQVNFWKMQPQDDMEVEVLQTTAKVVYYINWSAL